MPRIKQDAHLHGLARRGAEMRLREIADEIKLLFSAFPDLRDSFDPEELPISFILKRGAARAAATGARRSGQRGWTPEQRKAAAARMKAYWAKRKATRSK